MVGDPFQGYKHPIVKNVRKVSAALTNEELEFEPVPPGRMWVIENIALEDETNAFTSLRVYVRMGGINQYLLEDYSLLAGRLYWHDGPLYIPTRTILVARFVGTSASDVLQAYINGFEVTQAKDEPRE